MKPLLDGSPRQVRYLAKEKRGGKLVQRWNLIVPESILRRNWEEAADALA